MVDQVWCTHELGMADMEADDDAGAAAVANSLVKFGEREGPDRARVRLPCPWRNNVGRKPCTSKCSWLKFKILIAELESIHPSMFM